MGKLKTLWQNVVQFHEGRLLPTLTTMTAEEYQRNADVQFARAKRLSDFVGIIIRWSFAQFASLYFFPKRLSPLAYGFGRMYSGSARSLQWCLQLA
jgi:hypothetical protein